MIFDEFTKTAFDVYLETKPYKTSNSLDALYATGEEVFERTSTTIRRTDEDFIAPYKLVLDVTNQVRIVQFPCVLDASRTAPGSSGDGREWIWEESLSPVSYTQEAIARHASAQPHPGNKGEKITNKRLKKAPSPINEVTDGSPVKVWSRRLQGFAVTDQIPDLKTYGVKYESTLPADRVLCSFPMMNVQGTLFLDTCALAKVTGKAKDDCEKILSALSEKGLSSQTIPTSFVSGGLEGKSLYLNVHVNCCSQVQDSTQSALLEKVPVHCFLPSVSVGDRVMDLKHPSKLFGTVTYILPDNDSIVIFLDDADDKRIYSLQETWGISLLQVRRR